MMRFLIVLQPKPTHQTPRYIIVLSATATRTPCFLLIYGAAKRKLLIFTYLTATLRHNSKHCKKYQAQSNKITKNNAEKLLILWAFPADRSGPGHTLILHWP
ncbi:MAG: hypothetical protein ACHQF4_08825 [Sphingobacteriales bacterium]